MQQGLTETALITLWFDLTNQLLQCISITCTYTHFLILFMIVNTKSGWVHANQYGETKNWPQRGQI